MQEVKKECKTIVDLVLTEADLEEIVGSYGLRESNMMQAYQNGRCYIEKHNSDLLRWYDSQEFVTVLVWDSVAWVSRDGMETHELIVTSDVCEWLDQAFDDAEDDVARSIRWKNWPPSEQEESDDGGYVQYYDASIDD